MPGRLLPQTWLHDPTIYAPPKYKRACRYDAFAPDPFATMPLSLEATVAGLVSEAEHHRVARRGSTCLTRSLLIPRDHLEK